MHFQIIPLISCAKRKKANVIVDGAYYSEELSRKAVENNIMLIPIKTYRPAVQLSGIGTG